ncbi:MAG: DUF2298 domain-containing protein, partial [Ardenticatenaceae bacterium]
DNTFDRPGLPEPAALQAFEPSSISLDLGFADESFTVYDHPKVLIFANVARLDANSIRQIIENSAPAVTPNSSAEVSIRDMGLMLSPQAAQEQQQGGTWTDIVNPNRWTARFPVVSWLVLMQVIALLALPVTFFIFKPLADRGYLFSKVLGLLLVGLIVWLMASVGVMDFSRASIAVAVLLMGIVSAIIVIRRREELTAFVKDHWRVMAIGEALFLAAFFSFLIIRMANPDLWHPWRGGEKPMDFAYLNAVLRSTSFPPYDPWFAGGYINYYYWGQFLVATLIKATGIEPTIAYNLAIPMFFAMTAAGAFSIVYNLAEGTRRRLVARQHGNFPPPQ